MSKTIEPCNFSLLCEHIPNTVMDAENDEGATALMLACQKQALEQVDLLINKKVGTK